MKTTTNLGLKKIELTDSPPDITVQDFNWDKIDTEIKDLKDNKVAKETGKGLSSNDYTADEKIKLDLIAPRANNYSHPATHPASIIAQDANNRFATDVEKTTWNGKASASHTHTKSQITDFPTSLPANGGNADTVDGKHAADFISQPILLGSGVNLNSVLTPGMHYCPSNATAATYTNCPTDQAFSMLVERHAGTKQTLTEYIQNTARTWTRNEYTGTWGNWKIVGEGCNAASVGGRIITTDTAVAERGIHPTAVYGADIGTGVTLETGTIFFVYE